MAACAGDGISQQQRCPRLPMVARGCPSPRLPVVARSCPRVLGMATAGSGGARGCPRLPAVAHDCPRLPTAGSGVARGGARLLVVGRGCPRLWQQQAAELPAVARGCPRFPVVACGCPRLVGMATVASGVAHTDTYVCVKHHHVATPIRRNQITRTST